MKAIAEEQVRLEFEAKQKAMDDKIREMEYIKAMQEQE